MKVDIIVLSIPIFFLLIGLELIWDAYQRRKKGNGVYRLNDAVTNISCGIVDQVTGVFAKVFTLGAYTAVFHLVQSFWPHEIPNHWSMWALCFIGNDFFYYWAHRLSHQVNLLWTGHVVHHQSEDYNLSVALRQGAFQKIFTFWVYFPLAIIGFPPEWFLLSGAINLLYQFWIHTEAVKDMGWLENILNTPSHHRVHHGRNPKYIDKNHAGVFIIWDRLFGTFQKEEEHPTYGITIPVNTFNAVEAHTAPFKLLWKDVKSIPSFGDKIRYLMKPPGWYPESLGGFKPAPEIPSNMKKYDVEIPIQIHYYIIVQYIIALVVTSLFLFNLGKIGNLDKGIFIVFILYYLVSIGTVLNGKNAAKLTEAIRIIALGIAAWWMSQWLNPWILPTFGILSLVSLLWLMRLPFKSNMHESLS